MTSKEALYKILDKYETYHNIECCEEYFDLIEKDLERYEYICNLLKRFIEKIELSSNIFPSNFYRLIIDLTEQELELLKEVIQ